MFAPLPGVSRSGLTISAALALGLSKTWAVGFSLLMAVLAVSGAVVFEIRKALKTDMSALAGDKLLQVVAAATVAGVVGYLAIVWLVRLVRAGRFWYFSVYLVVLGMSLILVDQWQARRTPTDARPTPPAARPAAGIAPSPGDRPGADLGSVAFQPSSRALDRPVPPGARSDRPGPGAPGGV